MNNDIAISVKNLSKRYFLQHPVQDEHGHQTNELWALKDVSFDIKKGESVGIIGPNGSGKTTLLKILAGITKPTSGSVEINGRVASILDIGAGFHPELSGRENVFLNGQLYGFSKREIVAKFDEIISFSGIEKFIDEPVKNYSKGMYLRLAFSIMAHLDFDVYLLDEVLGVGDEEFYESILKKMEQLVISSKSVLFTSHNLNEIIRFTSMSLYLSTDRTLRFEESFSIVSEYLRRVNERKENELNESNLLRKFDIDESKNFVILESRVESEGVILSNPIHSNVKLRFIIKYYLKTLDMSFDFIFKIKCSNTFILFETASFNSNVFFKPNNLNPIETVFLEFPSGYFNHANLTIDLLVISDLKIVEEIRNLFFISFRNDDDLLFNRTGILQYKGVWGSLNT